MQRKKGFTLIELLVVIAIIAVLAAILFPVFARARKGAQASTCQSNLKQIGNAVKMYLTDWDDTYPTNRFVSTTGVVGAILLQPINLSPPDPPAGQTEPLKFVNGITWVEALYSYVETVVKEGDPQTTWKCPAASSTRYPTGTANWCAVNYVFNGNMIEQPEGVIKSASNLMLIREFSRLTTSMLRPMNNSTGTSTARPFYPFMNKYDGAIAPNDTSKECRMHANGSHILFADGHVKLFDIGYYPEWANITALNSWDGDNTQQWYNYYWLTPANADQKIKNMSIAISP